MHKTVKEALDLVEALKTATAGIDGVDIVLCPTYTSLSAVGCALGGTKMTLGAQGMFWKEQGAWTSQISPLMLTDVGDYPKLQDALLAYYREHAPQLVDAPPASTFMAVGAIVPSGARFQIDAVAVS